MHIKKEYEQIPNQKKHRTFLVLYFPHLVLTWSNTNI